MTEQEGNDVIWQGYVVPPGLVQKILVATRWKKPCPISRRNRERIMREYSNGTNPVGRWSIRRLSRLLYELEDQARNDERKRIRQELGL